MKAEQVAEVLERRAELVETLRAVPEDERTIVFVAATEEPGKMRETYARIPQPPRPAGPPVRTINDAGEIVPVPSAPGQEFVGPASFEQADAEAKALKSLMDKGPLLRDLPPIRRGRPLSAAEYVVAEPPQSPVLRQLTHALYDTLIVPEFCECLDVRLFADCRWFPDHTPKTERDCNLTVDGMLGQPLMYDLRRFELVFEKWSHPEDIKRVLRGLVFNWIRGQCVPWLRVTLSGFEPYVAVEDEAKDGGALRNEMLRDLKREGVWSHYRTSALTVEGKPQRIESTEAFRVDVKCPRPIGELHGPVRLKVLLQDTLYTCI